MEENKNQTGRQGFGGGKKNRTKRTMIIFIVEILVILIMVGILAVVLQRTKDSQGPLHASVDEITPEEMGISTQVQDMKEDEDSTMSGYMNIALFGLDSTTTRTQDLLKGFRSDCIMIASIELSTGDIKLVSVYRDTYLNLSNDTYNKCNAAYAKGGATWAISMLNSSLDMDITNWVSISYSALVKAVDDLGGIYVEVDEEERKHLNNYQISISEIMGVDYTPVKETGTLRLNGIQAAAYCRIRATSGDDFTRTSRQREVLSSLIDQAKQSDLSVLTAAFQDCIGDTYTSMDSEEILDILKNISKYRIVGQDAFPQMDKLALATISGKGSCVVPTDLEQNVIWLHKFLFEDEDYSPSDTVKEYSERIKIDTAAYIK